MTFTIRLARGAGRGWEAYGDTARPVLVTYSCPFCHQVNTVDSGKVSATGLVQGVLICVTALCNKKFRLQMVGWVHIPGFRTPSVYPAPYTDVCH